MHLIRQGDVLLIPITHIVTNTSPVKRDNGRVVLAYGEATGHAHAILEDNCDLVTDEQADELYLLVYGDDVELVHQEHSTLTIAPGTYRVVRQREYTSADMAPMQVAD